MGRKYIGLLEVDCVTIIGQLVILQIKTNSEQLFTMGGPLTFIRFKDRLNTLKVQHAVTQCGQRILVFVFMLMFEGDMNDIKTSALKILGSNSSYNRGFNKIELDKLEAGDYKTWSITLLYKLIQSTCGLQYSTDKKSKQRSNMREETLEHLLHQLKEWNKNISSDITLILTTEEKDKSLDTLKELCSKILAALANKVEISQEDGKMINQVVEFIIKDVKQNVNETTSRGCTKIDSKAS